MRHSDAMWHTRELIRSGRGDLERKRDASLQLLGEAVYRRIVDGDECTITVDDSMREMARAILSYDAELVELKDRQHGYEQEVVKHVTWDAIGNAKWAVMDDDRDDLTFVCPNCFTRTSIELEYCVGCGQPVEKLVLEGARLRFQKQQMEEQRRKDAAAEHCPHCGAPLPERCEEALFCPTCGAKLPAPGASAEAGPRCQASSPR